VPPVPLLPPPPSSEPQATNIQVSTPSRQFMTSASVANKFGLTAHLPMVIRVTAVCRCAVGSPAPVHI
jgi:hypothetical protein